MAIPAQTSASRNIVSSGGGKPRPQRTGDFALVIGVDDYPNFGTLHGAVRDATAFHDWLRRPQGGNLDEDRVWLVTSPPSAAAPIGIATPPGPPTAPLRSPRPVQNDVDDALAQLLRTVDDNGGGRRLYFYFAGHGVGSRNAVANVALLLADWSRDRARLGLASERYTKKLRRFGLFHELVVFLDCCRTNVKSATGMPCSVTPTLATPRIATDTFVAYATQAGVPSFETRTAGTWQGVFTRCLLRILDRNPGITAAALAAALKREVGSEPGQLRVQVPQVDDGLNSAQFGVAMLHELVVAFSAARVGPVELIDSGFQVIGTHDPAMGAWRIELPAGLYKLCDAAGDVRLLEFPRDNHVIF